MKVFIGLPSADGNYSGLMSDSLIYQLNRVEFMIYRVYRQRIASARNMLTKAFLDSDCTHLLFMDNDNSVAGGTLRKFLDHDKDIVTACILQRGSDSNVCVKKKRMITDTRFTHDFWQVEDLPGELFRVDTCGMGFCLIKRHVVEAVCKIKTSEGSYSDPFTEIANRSVFNDLFEFMPIGEDLSFCIKATNLGFEIWADPSVETEHIGIATTNKYVPKGNTSLTGACKTE